MSDELIKIGHLIDIKRHDLAEKLLREFLSRDPDRPLAHSFLALCLAHRREFARAVGEARTGIRLDPEAAYNHYVLARVWVLHDRLDEAEPAVREALRLKPDDADYLGQLSGILYDLHRSDESLRTAEEGLARDPDNVVCSNLRALNLMKRGESTEAGRVLDGALSRNPENAWSHINRAKALLDEGRPGRAKEHYIEALRLDPTREEARIGLVRAMKQRHPLFALWFFALRKIKQAPRAVISAILLLIGGAVVTAVLVTRGKGNPGRVVGALLVFAVYGFGIIPLLANQVFHFTIQFDRLGRTLLTRKQLVGANLFVAAAMSTLVVLAGMGMHVEAVSWAGVGMVTVSIPVAAYFKLTPGYRRILLVSFLLVALVLGFLVSGPSYIEVVSVLIAACALCIVPLILS